MHRHVPFMLTGAIAASAPATILTFDLNGQALAGYGDRAAAATDALGRRVLEGNGFTPDVRVEYIVTNTATPHSVYTSGYGDLTSALGHSGFGVAGFVRLTADAGALVTLNSFDVAAWVVDRSGAVIVRADGVEVFNSGQITIPGSTQPGNRLAFPPRPITGGTIEIELQDFGDLGIDNIDFDQRPASLFIGTQPTDAPLVDADTGATAQFSIRALSPSPTITYRWFLDGEPLADGPTYTGTATDTLTVSDIGADQEGRYTCRVEDGVDSLTSDPARLPVFGGTQTPDRPADFTGDGALNIFDIIAYFDAFAAGC